jgi:hypothetical protein
MPGGKPKGTTNNTLVSKDQQLAQAQMMLLRRLEGRTDAQIAVEFNCSVFTVGRRMQLAKREGNLQQAVDDAVNTLLAKATKAYEDLLTNPDTPAKVRREAAHDLMFGSGVLSNNNRAQINPEESAPQRAALSLRAWREKRFATKPTVPPSHPGVVEERHVLELTGELPEEALEADFTVDGEVGVETPAGFADFDGDGEGI